MKLVNALKIVALAIANVYLVVLMFTGERNEDSNVIDIFVDVIYLTGWGVIMWVSWKSPRVGAIMLISTSIMYLLFPFFSETGPAIILYSTSMLLVSPLLLAGLLFLLAAWKTPKATV